MFYFFVLYGSLLFFGFVIYVLFLLENILFFIVLVGYFGSYCGFKILLCFWKKSVVWVGGIEMFFKYDER